MFESAVAEMPSELVPKQGFVNGAGTLLRISLTTQPCSADIELMFAGATMLNLYDPNDLEPVELDDIRRMFHELFTPPPYRLSFDTPVKHLRPPREYITTENYLTFMPLFADAVNRSIQRPMHQPQLRLLQPQLPLLHHENANLHTNTRTQTDHPPLQPRTPIAPPSNAFSHCHLDL